MTTPAQPAPPPARGGQKKILGLPPMVVYGGGAALLALGYILYRKYKTATTAAAATNTNTTTPTGQTTDYSGQPCTDSNGNPGMTDALGNCVTSAGGSLNGTGGGGTGSSGGGSSSGSGTGQTGGGTASTGGGQATKTRPSKEIPIVTGIPYTEAVAYIVSYGFQARMSGSVPGNVNPNVVSQTPAGGTYAPQGSIVTLAVS